MPAASDFRLYHSNALEVLAGLLAEDVAKLPADGDWLRPDVVLVPQFSMRRWLQQVLAERLGICANLKFLTPGEFVDFALDENLGPAPESDRLAPDTLRWHVLRELRRAPPAALADFVAGDDPLKPWSLANALADTYEKYQAWRRDWLLDWERSERARHGAIPRQAQDDRDWQAALWRRIARNRPHRARRIDDYLRRLREPHSRPAGLPPRLFVFACQNISPDVLQVIASQARAGTQHFYLHTPARAFWGDLTRWPDYAPSEDDAFLGGDGLHAPNPLLAAWGQAGRDFIAGLVSGESVAPAFELAPHAEPPLHSLLGRLQRDVLDNQGPLAANTDADWPRAQVDRADASLQFHSCHTRLREVQVLHDQLRALLEQSAGDGQLPLQPRDIAVLAPDIDLYAPHIEAVFGGALGSARELPYTIADASPLASAPLAEAFLRLLRLPLQPLTVSDVLDLLAVPAIAARFDIDDAARGLLQDWLETAGARWGLDAADRARHDAHAERTYTFEFAIDRLLLGYATDAEDDIAGVAPWPDLEGQSAFALDGLIRLLAVLRRFSVRLDTAQPPAVWARELETLLDDAFGSGGFGSNPHADEDAGVIKALRQAIAAFAQGAARAEYTEPVEHAVVFEHFRSELGTADARAPFLSGGVCFGRMVPMRLIPFQVICLLGMDEDAFPARDPRDPVNRLAQALDTRERRVGDPSRRDADRYLFLQLFASAGRVFYLSWLGQDPRDNSRREPSVLVAELLDCAARYHQADVERMSRELIVRHALQPFSPAAFGAAHADEKAADPRRFSFDARWRDAADEGVARLREPPFVAMGTPALTATESEPVVTLQRLRSALQRPQACYLQDGLGLRLPQDEPPLLDHEPLGMPDPLSRYFLREEIFARWLREGRPPDAPELHAALLARALIAPGADGRTTLAVVIAEIAPLVARTLAMGFTAQAEKRPVDLDLQGTRLQGVLDGVHPAGLLRVTLRPDGRHGGNVVRNGLDHLAASLLGLPTHEIHFDKKDGEVVHRHREACRPDVAADVLRALVALRQRALREPLPFLAKSGFELWTVISNDADALAKGFELAGKRWQGDGERVFAEATPATRLALRGRDPFFDEDAVARAAFVAITQRVFAALEHGQPFDAEALP